MRPLAVPGQNKSQQHDEIGTTRPSPAGHFLRLAARHLPDVHTAAAASRRHRQWRSGDNAVLAKQFSPIDADYRPRKDHTRLDDRRITAGVHRSAATSAAAAAGCRRSSRTKRRYRRHRCLCKVHWSTS